MHLVGQRLGQYEITELIGSGGMATVYKAYQPGLNRSVAIKVLPLHYAASANFEERFIREARAVAQLSHPNILPIYDVGVENGLRYFVMKYVPGQTLRQLLKQPMTLATVSRYIDQIASALDHAHSQGILHRDIKPDNMLLEGDWLLLADFGLAKIMEANEPLTYSGKILGTSAYVSPEQAKGETVDQRTDIYSLGIVLYEMVTGQVPYQGNTPMEIIFKHVYERIPPARHYNPNLPETIEDIIFKATAKNPTDRYQRAGELAEALRAQLDTIATIESRPTQKQPAHCFLCYKHHIDPDEQLATQISDFITKRGHRVSINPIPQTVESWLRQVDQEIKNCDYVILLLSRESVESEVVKTELRYVYEYQKLQGRPHLLLVRMTHATLPATSIDNFLNPLHEINCRHQADYEQVCQDILVAIEGGLTQLELPLTRPVKESTTSPQVGRLAPRQSRPQRLQPAANPKFHEALEAPGGVVKLRDRFYIEREADIHLKREIIKPGTTTTIRAPGQTGKSSLLIRGKHYAEQHGAKVVYLDLHDFGSDRLASPDIFLRELAESIVYELQLDPTEAEQSWQGLLGPQKKLTYFIGQQVLPRFKTPVILIMDDVDCLLQTPFHEDFFGLVRSWHNRRALDEHWGRLNIVMAISTEPHMLIADVNQSPFNVGYKLYLEDFTEAQVLDLNERYGSPIKPNEFSQLMRLLSGHPYLTRQAFYTLVAEKISWSDLTRVVTSNQGPFGSHLRHLHELLYNEPGLQEAMKQIIKGNHCKDDRAIFRLLRAGLVKGNGKFYTCRCDLYRIYFQDKFKLSRSKTIFDQ
jgi:serine/threonine protein kinase